jgi:hypothetical protein
MRLFAQYKNPIVRTQQNGKVLEVLENCVGVDSRYLKGFNRVAGKEHYLCAICNEDGTWSCLKPICGEDLECLNFPDLEFGERYNMQIDKDSRKVCLIKTDKQNKLHLFPLQDKLIKETKSTYKSLFTFAEQTFAEECDKLIHILGIHPSDIFKV